MFYAFFKIYFAAQRIIELNISWPSNFFKKSFMVPPINFSLSSLQCRSISGWLVFTEIFKALRNFNIHNNIQTVTFTQNIWKK